MQLPSSMRSKKASQGGKEEKGKAAEPRLPHLLSFFPLSFGGVAIIMLGLFGMGLYGHYERVKTDHFTHVQHSAGIFVQDLNRQIQGIRTHIAQLTQDARLIQVLASQDLDELRVLETVLKKRIPQAIRVRLFPSRSQDAVIQDGRGLSYAGLDLVRQAREDQQIPPLEVHRVGQKDEHIALAAPVYEGKQLLGVIHAALPLSLLPDPSAVLGKENPAFLQQRVGNHLITLNLGQSRKPPAGEPSDRIPVRNTRWELAVWAAPPAFSETFSPVWWLLAYGLSLGLLAFVIWFPARRIQNALEEDLLRLAAAVEAVARRGKPGKPRYDFQETYAVGMRVHYALQELASVSSEGPRTSKAVEAAALSESEQSREEKPPGEKRSKVSQAPASDAKESEDSQAAASEDSEELDSDIPPALEEFFRNADAADEAVEVEAQTLSALSEKYAGIRKKEQQAPEKAEPEQPAEKAEALEISDLDALDLDDKSEGWEEAGPPAREERAQAVQGKAGEKAPAVEPLDFDEIDLDELVPMSEEEEAEAWDVEPLLEPEAPSRPGDAQFTGPLAEASRRLFHEGEIRGVFGEDLTLHLVRNMGRAIAEVMQERDQSQCYVGQDTRTSSKKMTQALVRGLQESGCRVVDLGLVPTPLVCFAAAQESSSGVMVTAGHQPPDHNGMKVLIGGKPLNEKELETLRIRLLREDFPKGAGSYQQQDLHEAYIQQVQSDIALARSLKIVLDCGNGAASRLAPALYRALDVEVIELHCDPSAGFPNGLVSDPVRADCFKALQSRVQEEGADLGLLFDGDGDRLGLVDAQGNMHWGDRLLMILIQDVLSRNPGTDVIFDVKCGHRLPGSILMNGGLPVMMPSRRSAMQEKLAESNALIAGTWDGRIFLRDRWNGFDDALYAGARLLEILALDPRSSTEVFADLPPSVSVPEIVLPLAEGEAQKLMEQCLAAADRLEDAQVFKIDGLRIDCSEGAGLVQAADDQLRFHFEGADEAALRGVMELMRSIFQAVAPKLNLPF